MSFSQDIKEEILRDHKLNKCCKEVEKLAENLTESYEYIDFSKGVLDNLKKNKCCRKSFLRGLFLGTGCIVDPNTDYHFEITCKNKKTAGHICELLNELIGFNFKVIRRSINQYVIYSKDSEEISLILSFLGASSSLLKFENIRVERSIKNNINRNINCETANLSKTISAAYTQIMAIEKLEKSNKFKELPIELREIGNLRKKHPEMSLSDLTSLYGGRLTKSGINHRLKKIVEISKDIEKN